MTKITALAVENLELLHALTEQPSPLTARALAAQLGRDESNFAKTVKRLREDGYIAADALALTPAGARVARLIGETGEIRAPGDQLLLRFRELEASGDNERGATGSPKGDRPRDQAKPDAALEGLVADLVERGQLQNLVVTAPGAADSPQGDRRRDHEPKYRVQIGHRRLAAVGLAIERGLWPSDRPLRCVLVTETDAARLSLMRLAENLHRLDLHPLDEGAAFQRLRDQHGFSTERIAGELGRSRRHVQDRITVFEQTTPDEQRRMRLPDDDDEHLRYTDARDAAAQRRKPPPPEATAASIPPPEGEATRDSERVGASGASDSSSPAPNADDVAAIELTPAAQIALAELAHKIDATAQPGEERVAAVYGFANDRAAGQLIREGLVMFIHSPGRPHVVGVVTARGRARLKAKPIGVRTPYKTAWLNAPAGKEPPAQPAASAPRSDVHALVGDSFSQQLRQASAETTETDPLIPAEAGPQAGLSDEIAPFPRQLVLTLGRAACSLQGNVAKLDLDGWPFRLELEDVRALRDLLNDVITELGMRKAEDRAAEGDSDPPPKPKLTLAQECGLRALAAAGSLDAATSISWMDERLRGVAAGTLSKLQEKGLAHSKVRSTSGGSRQNHYWLTPAGVAIAKLEGQA